jgi:AcrR family transcriptional regulator
MPKNTSDNAIPTRKRDAQATKEAILEAARMVFMNKGYDSAGTREIAQRAGVNVALISRYFGSKEGLFTQAIPPTLTLAPLIEGPMEDFGARVAGHFVHKNLEGEYDPTLALIRAASSKDAVHVLKKTLDEQFTKPLAARLQGENKFERAALIGSFLAGFDFTARVVGVKTTENSDKSAVETLVAKILQDLVDG